MSDADAAGYATLTRFIAARGGLSPEAYKDRCLRRRIAVRMRAVGVHTYREYVGVLEASAEELGRLTDALTINVTRFYRNPETWLALAATPLPALLERVDGDGEGLRAWSAGCSGGEEAHTLAMVVADLAERRLRPRWLAGLRIDATDIDAASLARARAGRYRADAFSELPADLLRYTREDGDHRVVAAPLRRAVQVTRHDLVQEPPPHDAYDLVLCRNVLIYFSRASQERVFHAFADALRPGGLLVLGKVESIVGSARTRFALVDTRERLYRRLP